MGLSMRLLLRASLAFLAVLLISHAPVLAGEKAPSPYDDTRMGTVVDGRQNYPFTLRGVTIKWDVSCNKGNGGDCLKLAKAFEDGFGALDPDKRAAVGYYMLACKRGVGTGCAKAAQWLREGTPGYTNPALADQQAAHGCNDLKDQSSCAFMAEGLASRGGSSDAQVGALVDNACGAGNDDGCRIKANALYGRGDAASYAEAIKLFEPACRANKAWGCMGLQDAYRFGRGVPRDMAKADALAKAGCLQGQGVKVRLCTLYGNALTLSTTKSEINRGEKLLDAGCLAGDGVACYLIGDFGLDPKAGATTTKGEAYYYLRRGCDLGTARSCRLLGNVYSGGLGLDAEPVVEYALQAKACRIADQEACVRAERLLAADPGIKARMPAIDPAGTVPEQLAQAKAAADRGQAMLAAITVMRLVREENEDAQWLMGGWMYYGLPGVFGTERRSDGLILFENAARVGHVDAAVFMGMAYWYGDGVPEDRTKGENYMAIAASRGSPMAAAILRSMKAEPIRQENARRQQEYEAWQAAREADWSRSWASYTPTWSVPSNSSTSSWSGPSFDQIQANAQFNQFVDSYSYGRSCPASNRYC